MRRKYKRRVKEVRGKVDTAGYRFEKTTGPAAPSGQSGANRVCYTGALVQQGFKEHPKPSQSKRRPSPVVEQHGFFASGYRRQEHAHCTRLGPVSSASITFGRAGVCRVSCVVPSTSGEQYSTQ